MQNKPLRNLFKIKMKKKNNQQMYWILGIIAIAVFIIGGQQGWFKSFSVTNQPIEIQPELNKPLISSCSQICTQQGFDEGYSSLICNVGETKVTYGYAGQPPILTCCCSNEVEEEEEEIIPPPCRFHGISSPLDPFTASDCYGDCSTGVCTFSIVRGMPMCGCKEEIDTDGDGIPDSSDLDDDNDGYSDAEENAEGTDPLDPNDNPGIIDWDSLWENCVTNFGVQYNFQALRNPVTEQNCFEYADQFCMENIGRPMMIFDQDGEYCCAFTCMNEPFSPSECQNVANNLGFLFSGLAPEEFFCVEMADMECNGMGSSLGDFDYIEADCCVWSCV